MKNKLQDIRDNLMDVYKKVETNYEEGGEDESELLYDLYSATAETLNALDELLEG